MEKATRSQVHVTPPGAHSACSREGAAPARTCSRESPAIWTGTSGKGRHQSVWILCLAFGTRYVFLAGTCPHNNFKFVTTIFTFKFINWHDLSPPFILDKSNPGSDLCQQVTLKNFL